MSQTYIPVLETVELRRVRMAPIRPPEMGSALVIERLVGDPLVVLPGNRVPDPRSGKYRRMHRVDMRTRGLSFTVTAPSRDAAFSFSVTVRFACRIVDPVVIVRDEINDMTAALSPSLAGIVREVASRFDVMDPAGAEAAIATRLNTARPHPTVELSGFNVAVSMMDTAEIVTARRETRVDEARRGAMRKVVDGGRDEMLAHIMAIENGDPMALLDRERNDRATETQAKLDSLRILMGSNMEDFNVAEVRKQALTEFFTGDGAGITAKRTDFRERIERRTRGELGESKVVEGNVPEVSEPAASAEEKHRPNRLRGGLAKPSDREDG